jgi:DNA-binding NarL/FixJ family response regulator
MALGARVFVAAEDPFLRSALRLLLEHEEGVSVVGEGGEPARLVEEARAAEPDLVLLTWGIARDGAPDLVASLKGIPSRPRVIALNCCPGAATVAGRAGVDELLRSGESPDRLLAAVRSTMWTQ